MKASENRSEAKNLTTLGFNSWHKEKYGIPEEHLSFYRITEVHRGNYTLSNGEHESLAELSGRFLYQAEESLDYPTVGDWVLAQGFDSSSAIIHALLPRKSVLKRLDPGKAVSFQLIAANIEYAFIVQSVNANFDLNRLERYLVMVNESGITPIILLTKSDLISGEQLKKIMETLEPYRETYTVLSLSALSGEGIQKFRESLLPSTTYSLLGSSGVGKTTLLNSLIGEHRFEVKEIRAKDDKGKHSTTKRQLVCLNSGAIFIDTPGMRELGNFAVSSGIEQTFDTIQYYTSQCRFKNCTHTKEKGCALLKAVKTGAVSKEQYENFMKIQKEAQFYEMSAYDKRQKDKKFTKYCKNIQKNMRKK